MPPGRQDRAEKRKQKSGDEEPGQSPARSPHLRAIPLIACCGRIGTRHHGILPPFRRPPPCAGTESHTVICDVLWETRKVRPYDIDLMEFNFGSGIASARPGQREVVLLWRRLPPSFCWSTPPMAGFLFARAVESCPEKEEAPCLGHGASLRGAGDELGFVAGDANKSMTTYFMIALLSARRPPNRPATE